MHKGVYTHTDGDYLDYRSDSEFWWETYLVHALTLSKEPRVVSFDELSATFRWKEGLQFYLPEEFYYEENP